MEKGMRPAPKKRLSRFQVAVILCAIGFTAWYIYTSFAPETARYATVANGLLGANYTGDALIVRDETPYESESVTDIKYKAEEGKACGRGLEICSVFSSGYSTREMTTLQGYRDEIRDYVTKLLEQETTYDARMARVSSDVLARAREVREIIGGGRGSLTNQEMLLRTAISTRQKYIQNKYATDQRLTRLLGDEQAQMQRIDSWTKQYAATTDAIVSFYSDGYEYGLTMANYADYSPAQVRQMIGGQKPERSITSRSKTTIYRTIDDGEWVVLMLVHDTSWNPVEGQQYELQLERFENTQVMATVESFTRSGGELLVRLKVNSSVAPVLYMRTCQVTLGDKIATMKVPSRAILHQDGTAGVVIVDGANESFLPVNVVYDNGQNAFVISVNQGLLFAGQTVKLF